MVFDRKTSSIEQKYVHPYNINTLNNTISVMQTTMMKVENCRTKMTITEILGYSGPMIILQAIPELFTTIAIISTRKPWEISLFLMDRFIGSPP